MLLVLVIQLVVCMIQLVDVVVLFKVTFLLKF
jgi:hypothetical protein